MNGERTPQVSSRRSFLGKFGLVAAGVVGGAAAGAGTAAASSGGMDKQTLSVDVACIGDTWRNAIPEQNTDANDIRTAFSVEGWIYPRGTIPGDGFVPTETDSIGRWICRGWLILTGERPEPHVISTQDFVFGRISEADLFPTDTLSCQGLEGTMTSQGATRGVVCGTGRYLGAVGQAVQVQTSINTTVFNNPGQGPAPNFSFDFDLRLPS